MTDVSDLAGIDCGPVRLLIALTENEPPVGTVVVDGGQSIEFTGWLGLLNLLGDIVDSAQFADVSGASLSVDVAQPTQNASVDPVTRAPILDSGEA